MRHIRENLLSSTVYRSQPEDICLFVHTKTKTKTYMSFTSDDQKADRVNHLNKNI